MRHSLASWYSTGMLEGYLCSGDPNAFRSEREWEAADAPRGMEAWAYWAGFNAGYGELSPEDEA